MDFVNILAISIALAMDAFAVSISAGIQLKDVSVRQTFRLSWHFGLFQAFMPIIGWSLGMKVYSAIEKYDHWVAFTLLVLVGGNMLREALFHDDSEEKSQKDPTRGSTLVLLSVATSIDALAIGFSISMLNVSIVLPAIIIGLVAAMFTIIGLHLGKKVSSFSKLSTYAESIGAMVLFCIGLNILYEHGVFNFLTY